MAIGFPPYSQQSSSGDRYDFNDLPPEIAIEHQALNRKQQIANMLIQQGLQPAQGQMVGGWYVPASPLQGVAGLAQIAAGKYASSRNDETRRGLVGKSKQMYADAMSQYMDATKDKTSTATPEIAGPGAPQPAAQQPTAPELPISEAPRAETGYQMGADESGWAPQEPIRDYNAAPAMPAPAIQEGPRPTGGASTTTVTPRTAKERREAIIQHLAMSQIPQAQRMGQFMLGEMDREEARGDQFAFRKEDREDTQAFQKQQNEEGLAVRREGIESNALSRAEQMRNTMAVTQMHIGAEERAGRSANDLKAQLAQQSADLQKTLHSMDNRSREKTAGIGADAKIEAAGMKSGANRPMSATAQKELIQTDEQIQGGTAATKALDEALGINNSAMGFTGAGAVASAGSFLPEAIRPKAVDATVNLDNIVQSSALPQLKDIFGGMPTEGERKILLEMQGSSSKTPAQRQEIFRRAKAAAQRRIEFNKQKSGQIRQGTYFSEQGGVPAELMDPTPEEAQPAGKAPDERSEYEALKKKYGR